MLIIMRITTTTTTTAATAITITISINITTNATTTTTTIDIAIAISTVIIAIVFDNIIITLILIIVSILIGVSIVFFLSWAPINCFNMALDLLGIVQVNFIRVTKDEENYYESVLSSPKSQDFKYKRRYIFEILKYT